MERGGRNLAGKFSWIYEIDKPVFDDITVIQYYSIFWKCYSIYV